MFDRVLNTLLLWLAKALFVIHNSKSKIFVFSGVQWLMKRGNLVSKRRSCSMSCLLYGWSCSINYRSPIIFVIRWYGCQVAWTSVEGLTLCPHTALISVGKKWILLFFKCCRHWWTEETKLLLIRCSLITQQPGMIMGWKKGNIKAILVNQYFN